MKKSILVLLTWCIAVTAFAQNSNVNKANAYITDGRLAEARDLIDEAIKHEKTMGKARTWYVRGLVYSAIATSEDAEVQALDANAVLVAHESFMKVETLEKEGSNYYTLSQVQEESLYSSVFNEGVEYFQNDQFSEAFVKFHYLTILSPTDTLGYLYAGYSAESDAMYEEAIEMYSAAMELDNCPKMIYTQSMVVLETGLDDLEGALEVAKKGMEKFPDDQTFDKSIIAYYIKLERTEEAKLALEEALEVEPENSNLWYNLGYLNGETGNYDESVEAYRKAIEVDPNYMDAYINLAFTITEKAKEVRAEAMEMDLDTYQKEGAAIEAKADEYYKQALPVLEKAIEITPDDQAILESLSGLYIRLKMTDEAEEVKKKLVSLGYWEDN